MATIPEPQTSTRKAIFEHYEKTADRQGRPHLGASEIGHECDRYLWLSFRWAKPAAPAGFASGKVPSSAPWAKK